MADYGELEDQLNDEEAGAARGGLDTLLEDDDDDDFRPAQLQEEPEEDEEDVFGEAAPAPAPAPAPAAPAGPTDMKAKLQALAEKKRREEAEGGRKKKDKGDKGGDKGSEKKRKRDKGDKGSSGKDKGGDKAGKKKQRPQRTPGGGGDEEGGARPPRPAAGGGGGEDSEDSREMKEQDADRAFIDDDGEVNQQGEEEELGSDVVPDEEDEGAEAARLAAAPEAMEGDGEAMDEGDLFGRKKKKKQQSEQQMMEELNDRVAKMEAAAEADMEAHLAKKPALNKLKMLKEVEQLLAQRKYHELFLHAGGLGTLKAWLEPYSDGTLPNVKIRTAVLSFCKLLPIDTAHDDVRENLKKSQLGSRVMFLAKCPDETQANRKLALDLVQKWARPIFYDPEAEAEKKRAKEEALRMARAQAMEAQRARDEQEEAERAARNKVRVGEQGYRWHAVIPQTLKLDYVVAPQTDPNAVGGNGGDGEGMGMGGEGMMMGGGGAGAGAGGGGKKDEGRFAKKMREVQRKLKGSTARAAVPSVEGRGIVL